jgi:3-phenylpropionate/cinnamic acid dioxygenase small subunit
MCELAEIQNLLSRYCELFDEGDLDGYAELFAHGRIVNRHGVLEGRDEVRAFQDNILLYDGTPRTRHLYSNLQVEFSDDERRAHARSCVNVFQAVPGFPLQSILVGVYDDDLEKVDGQWRFVERRFTNSLMGDCTHHGRLPLPAGAPGAVAEGVAQA